MSVVQLKSYYVDGHYVKKQHTLPLVWDPICKAPKGVKATIAGTKNVIVSVLDFLGKPLLFGLFGITFKHNAISQAESKNVQCVY